MGSEILGALGLKTNPFPPGACKDNYFQTRDTKRILDELLYGIKNRKGFLLLSGEVGFGKTSLLIQLIPMMERGNVTTAWLFNTVLGKRDLMLSIARDFGLEPAEDASLSQLIGDLHDFFIDQAQKERNSAILIDEAHLLDFEQLEALRMLSNLELNGEKLVQVLLAGQPEIMKTLSREDLRQFRNRINIFVELPGLDLDDTSSYVNFKLAMAGSDLRLRGKPLEMIWKGSAGNIRLINLIMEKTLYALVAFSQRDITPFIVRAAIKDIAPCHHEAAQRIKSFGKRKRLGLVLAGVLVLAGLAAAAMYIAPGIQATRSKTPMADRLSEPKNTISDTSPAPRAKPVNMTGFMNRTKVPDRAQEPNRTSELDLTEAVRARTREGGDGNMTSALKEPAQPLDEAASKSAAEFLTRLELPDLTPSFIEALKKKDISLIEKALADLGRKEWRVVPLNRLPRGGRELHHDFPWREHTGQDPVWIALWKPGIEMSALHPGYTGSEVSKLQEMLASLGYYNGLIDGTFGFGTWRALHHFQAAQKLETTGLPDPATHLWLTALNMPEY